MSNTREPCHPAGACKVCDALRAVNVPAVPARLPVGTVETMPAVSDRRACGVDGCPEVAERCGAHLQDRIAASMRKDIADAAARPVREGKGREVPHDEMRGRAWSKRT